MGVWNEPGMYLEANSLTAGDCCPTSSTDWSMTAYYLCPNYAIISYRHQLRGKPSVCNDHRAGHSSWSEAATAGANALPPLVVRDKRAFGPWELRSAWTWCSPASLGAPVRRKRWEGQFERLHWPVGQQGPLKGCREHLLTPALPVLWAYCHCQHHHRP